MLAKTHMMSSATILLPTLYFIPIEYAAVFIVAGMLGSLFPDIDEPRSLISSKVYFVSKLISMFTKHRGVTHTIAILVLYSAIILWISDLYFTLEIGVYAALGFSLGNLLHCMGDAATKEGGVAIFYPITSKRFYILPHSLRFKTAGTLERAFILPFFSVLVIGELFLISKFITQQ